jgi:hypothetical protein
MSNILPTPQENPISAPQQGVDNSAVMDQVKKKHQPDQRDEVKKAKDRILKVMKQFNIPAQKLVQAGQYAQAALKDPKMYPIAIQTAINEGILTPDQAPKGGQVDYKLLANGISVGKIAQMLIDEGAA